MVVSNRGDQRPHSLTRHNSKSAAPSPSAEEPEDIAILPDSSKAFVACAGSAQVASIDLRTDKLLALLDVGKTPGRSRS